MYDLPITASCLICCRYGLPQSESLCIVGVVVGVGVMERRASVNWRHFLWQLGAWVGSTLVVGLTVAVLFAQVNPESD